MATPPIPHSLAKSAKSTPALQLSDEARAGALWTFVQAQAPRFTFGEALEVIRALRLEPHADHKVMAKRLREELRARRIELKHVNALHAVSRLAGHASWHTDDEAPRPRLRLYVFQGNTAQFKEYEFSSWHALAETLPAWVDTLYASGQLPLGVLTLNFTARSLNFTVPVPSQHADRARLRINDMCPMGGVTPILEDDKEWLADAPFALEKLRRHLEETGKAVLDGYAALYLCANSGDKPWNTNSVSAADVVNSELVLLRQDSEEDPHSGYEIARGDELTCWHQLELSLRDDKSTAGAPAPNVTIPKEGLGAWFVNGIRYVWELETLKPNEYIPGQIQRGLGIEDCERLLRRYRLARKIHASGFRHHDLNKHVAYLSGPPETWRIDLRRILHVLEKAGLNWDGYIEKFGAEKLPMLATLPVGFVMQLLEDLKVENPNQVFAWPSLAKMGLATDDRLLCSLMPRVDAVRYAKPRDLDSKTLEDLHNAVDEFASGLRLQKIVAAGGLQNEDELPYLVYAADAQELRLAAESMGLQMYAAVAPHLTSTKGLLPETLGIKTWPWAFGHALLLRFERAGAAQ